MRFKVLTVLVLALVPIALADGDQAWASDGYGQNTNPYAGAQVSGGVLIVRAGVTVWVPPAGSVLARVSKPAVSGGAGSTTTVDPGQPYGCTYHVDPQALAVLGPGGPLPGQWVTPVCAGPGVIDPMPPFWVSGAKPAPAGPVAPASPVVLARQAVKSLPFSAPSVSMAPPLGDSQLVGVATWLWIDPGAWRSLSESVTAGPVTTTATATPVKVVWDMGDGDTVTCDGPGVVYDPSKPDASTGCSYVWPAPGSFQVTATIYWSVSWTVTGAAGGGTLGLDSGPSAGVSVQVVESQAINTTNVSGN